MIPPPTRHPDLFLPSGGNWEGGTQDADGNHWVHVPWKGWTRHQPSMVTSIQPERNTMSTTRRRLDPELPPIPLGFKVWFAFCAIIGLSVLGVAAWAIIKIVNHVTG